MVKSCMKKGKRNLRVRFNKTVQDNEGCKKKIKRVNLTRLAYSVLKTPLLDIDREFMLELLAKNKQTSSNHRAKREVIRALDRLENRIITHKGAITTIGSKCVTRYDHKKNVDWSTKLAVAAMVLED
jgi:hypothetical protein